MQKKDKRAGETPNFGLFIMPLLGDMSLSYSSQKDDSH